MAKLCKEVLSYIFRMFCICVYKVCFMFMWLISWPIIKLGYRIVPRLTGKTKEELRERHLKLLITLTEVYFKLQFLLKKKQWGMLLNIIRLAILHWFTKSLSEMLNEELPEKKFFVAYDGVLHFIIRNTVWILIFSTLIYKYFDINALRDFWYNIFDDWMVRDFNAEYLLYHGYPMAYQQYALMLVYTIITGIRIIILVMSKVIRREFLIYKEYAVMFEATVFSWVIYELLYFRFNLGPVWDAEKPTIVNVWEERLSIVIEHIVYKHPVMVFILVVVISLYILIKWWVIEEVREEIRDMYDDVFIELQETDSELDFKNAEEIIMNEIKDIVNYIKSEDGLQLRVVLNPEEHYWVWWQNRREDFIYLYMKRWAAMCWIDAIRYFLPNAWVDNTFAYVVAIDTMKGELLEKRKRRELRLAADKKYEDFIDNMFHGIFFQNVNKTRNKRKMNNAIIQAIIKKKLKAKFASETVEPKDGEKKVQ